MMWEVYFAGTVGMAGYQTWKNTRLEMKYNRLSYAEIAAISAVWPIAFIILFIQTVFAGLNKIDPN